MERRGGVGYPLVGSAERVLVLRRPRVALRHVARKPGRLGRVRRDERSRLPLVDGGQTDQVVEQRGAGVTSLA